MRHISSVIRNRDENSTREGLSSGKRERKKVKCEKKTTRTNVNRFSPCREIPPWRTFQEISTRPSRNGNFWSFKFKKVKEKEMGPAVSPFFLFLFFFVYLYLSLSLYFFHPHSPSLSFSRSHSRPIFLDRSTGNILESTAR